MSVDPLAIPLSNDLLDALAERVGERLREKRRWASIEGVAEYLYGEVTEESVRQVRQLRERGLDAKKPGKRLIFDLREVDEWLEREGWT